MKPATRNKIKSLLIKYKDEAFQCLYPENGWQWGCCSRKGLSNTLKLMNKILRQIPVDAWSINTANNRVRQGNWSITFGFDRKRMLADLRYSKDDHTAWVIKRGNKFVNFDIGGS